MTTLIQHVTDSTQPFWQLLFLHCQMHHESETTMHVFTCALCKQLFALATTGKGDVDQASS